MLNYTHVLSSIWGLYFLVSPITGNKHLFYLVRCDVSRKTNISVTLLFTTKVHLFHTKKNLWFHRYHFSHIKLSFFKKVCIFVPISHITSCSQTLFPWRKIVLFSYTNLAFIFSKNYMENHQKLPISLIFHIFFSKHYPFHGPSQNPQNSTYFTKCFKHATGNLLFSIMY